MSLKDLWSLHHRQTIFVRTVVNRFAWRGFLFNIFFLIGGRKKSFRVNVEVRCHLVFLWDEGQAILFYVSFLICYLFIYFSLWSSFFIYIDFSRNMASYSYDFFFWCCVREILCKTMMKGSLEIRHRLFIKIYVYVFQL